MALPKALRLVRQTEQTAAAITAAAPVAMAAPIYDRLASGTAYGPTIPRYAALTVPPFERGLSLIANTVASLPLVETTRDTLERVPSRPLLEVLDPDLPPFTTVQSLVDDGICYGSAWLKVSRRDLEGWPTAVKRLDPNLVTVDDTKGQVYVDGRRVADRDLIRFPFRPVGVLTTGYSAIATAMALEAAAKRYADTPLPSMALKNTGADLPAAQVEDMLTAWETARASRGTAYLNSVIDAQAFGWDAAQLQLVEARSYSATQIARVLNLDPYWVGANSSGSSYTYANRVDLYSQLVDTSLALYLGVISQRLSMGDVTPPDRRVRFDTSPLLRVDLPGRVDMVDRMLPLGILDIAESRQMLDLP